MFVQRGGGLQTLARLLGHERTKVAERYAHLADHDASDEFRCVQRGVFTMSKKRAAIKWPTRNGEHFVRAESIADIHNCPLYEAFVAVIPPPGAYIRGGKLYVPADEHHNIYALPTKGFRDTLEMLQKCHLGEQPYSVVDAWLVTQRMRSTEIYDLYKKTLKQSRILFKKFETLLASFVTFCKEMT